MRIDTRLAERLKKVNPSSTLAINAKAKKLKAEGRDIINFAAGEPDFDTPDFIKAAAIDAIKSGFTKYTPTAGTPELKNAVCEKFKRDNSLEYLPEQIVVSCGAKHSIFNALMALVNKGDEVLILEYDVLFTNYGRTGGAIMIRHKNFKFKINPIVSGTSNNNFVTRSLESVIPNIISIIRSVFLRRL